MARPRGTSRITAKGTRPSYAPDHAHGLDEPSHQKSSGPLLGWSIVAFLAAGVIILTTNYLGWIPASPSSAWIVIGLVAVLFGVLLATRWR